jgi:hypothetical protein
MIRIKLSFLFILFSVLNLQSQVFIMDSSAFVKKKLTIDEINLVSSYYGQDGNNSAVTGGEGTEKLTDIANTLDFKLTYDRGNGKKSSFGMEVGIDYYSSASSDNIDFNVSSASAVDIRYYPSLFYSQTNDNKKQTWGVNLSYSQEWDYFSRGGGLNYSKANKVGSKEIGVKLNAFFDTYDKYVPSEFRKGGINRGNGFNGSSPRNSFDGGITYSQVFTPKFQMSFILDLAYQQGFLSTPFHRVYKQDNSSPSLETLPDKRFKLPIGVRANYFVSEKLIIRSLYRYYTDDWGLQAHTLQLEAPLRLNKTLSLSPFLRYNNQHGMDYFYPYGEAPESSQFFSSDFDLSTFTSWFYGTGIRVTPFKSLKFIALQSIELRLGKYGRSNGMDGYLGAVHVQFKGF